MKNKKKAVIVLALVVLSIELLALLHIIRVPWFVEVALRVGALGWIAASVAMLSMYFSGDVTFEAVVLSGVLAVLAVTLTLSGAFVGTMTVINTLLPLGVISFILSDGTSSLHRRKTDGRRR